MTETTVIALVARAISGRIRTGDLAGNSLVAVGPGRVSDEQTEGFLAFDARSKGLAWSVRPYEWRKHQCHLSLEYRG